MPSAIAVSQPTRILSIALKSLTVLIGGLLALLLVAHLAWKYSGSNQWQLVTDKNGIQIYTLKKPGSTLDQFKAVTRIHTTLNQVVAAMTDTSSEACNEFARGCVSGPILQPLSPQNPYFVQEFQLKFPQPFARRELVAKTEFSQDPLTRALLVRCIAVPEMLPPNNCCLRITNMNNSWLYTPLANGQVEVQFLGNYDLLLPYFMFNHEVPHALYSLLSRLENIFNKSQYQQASFAFVKER